MVLTIQELSCRSVAVNSGLRYILYSCEMIYFPYKCLPFFPWISVQPLLTLLFFHLDAFAPILVLLRGELLQLTDQDGPTSSD